MDRPDSLAEAGYRLPVRGERGRYRPYGPLRTAFERWLEDARLRTSSPETNEGLYSAAFDSIRSIRPDPEEVESLVAAYGSHPHIQRAGLFLSAAYNHSGRSQIVYTGCEDVRLEEIGYRLGKHRTLVIPEGVEARNVGTKADAALVILGSAASVGDDCNAPVIVKGKASTIGGAASLDRDRPVVISGEVGSYVYGNERQITVATGKAPLGCFGLKFALTDQTEGLEGKGPFISWSSCGEITEDALESFVRSMTGAHPAPAPILVPQNEGQSYTLNFTERGILFRQGPSHLRHKQRWKPYRPLPALQSYLEEIAAPFLPGTPWEQQLEAARSLNRDQMREELSQYIAQLRLDWSRWLQDLYSQARQKLLKLTAAKRRP